MHLWFTESKTPLALPSISKSGKGKVVLVIGHRFYRQKKLVLFDIEFSPLRTIFPTTESMKEMAKVTLV